MTNKQATALKLADWQELSATIADMGRPADKKDKRRQTANELRRLHNANLELLEALEELMQWQVKNVKCWHNSAYDHAARVREKHGEKQ